MTFSRILTELENWQIDEIIKDLQKDQHTLACFRSKYSARNTLVNQCLDDNRLSETVASINTIRQTVAKEIDALLKQKSLNLEAIPETPVKGEHFDKVRIVCMDEAISYLQGEIQSSADREIGIKNKKRRDNNKAPLSEAEEQEIFQDEESWYKHNIDECDGFFHRPDGKVEIRQEVVN